MVSPPRSIFSYLRNHLLLLPSLFVINIIFLPLINSNKIRLSTDDSTLIVSKVFSYRLNPGNIVQNPFHHSTEIRTQSFLTEYLFGLISFVFKLNLIEIERFIVFATINAIFASFCFVLSTYLKHYSLYALMSFQILYLVDPVLFLRPISPGFHIAILFFTLGLIDRFFKSAKRNWLISISPLVIAVTYLTFSYIFYALLSLLVFSLMKLINAVTESKSKIQDFFHIFLLSLPVLFFATQQVLFPSVELNDLNFRWGIVDSHFPGSKKTILYGILGILLLLAYPATITKRMFFCIFCASILLSNSNIITGKSMEFEAHFTPPVLVALVLMLPHIVRILIGGAKTTHSPFIPSLSLAFLQIMGMTVFALLMSVYLQTFTRSHYKLQNPNISKISELSAELPVPENAQRDVISAPTLGSEEIPLITGRKLLYSINGTTFFPMSNYEVLERRVLNDLLQGNSSAYDVEDIRTIFSRHFLNFDQKTRYEKTLSVFQFSERKATLNKYYEKLIAYANSYRATLLKQSTLEQELLRFRVGTILVEYPRGRILDFLNCKILALERVKYELCRS